MKVFTPQEASNLKKLLNRIAHAREFASKCKECLFDVDAELAEVEVQAKVAQKMLEHFSGNPLKE